MASICINNCTCESTRRGLCDKCYYRSRSLVRAGKISWDELVVLGKARDFLPNLKRELKIKHKIDHNSEIKLLYQGSERNKLYEKHIIREKDRVEKCLCQLS